MYTLYKCVYVCVYTWKKGNKDEGREEIKIKRRKLGSEEKG